MPQKTINDVLREPINDVLHYAVDLAGELNDSVVQLHQTGHVTAVAYRRGDAAR